MQGFKRKLFYVTMFEVLAISFSSLGLALLAKESLAHTSLIALVTSTIAFLWNISYNYIFEFWESKQVKKGRCFVRRLMHTTFFQMGLVAMIVPLLSWKFNISLSEAFVMNLGMLVFFLFYTFIYDLCFEKLFGLPDSSK